MSSSTNKWAKPLYAFFAVIVIAVIVSSTYLYLLPPPQVLSANLAVGEVQKIDVNTPLRISFSRWMDQKSVENALHIMPAHPGVISWEGNTLVFRPEGDNWGMQKDYQVWIDNTAQDVLRKKLPESFYQRFAISGPPNVVMNLPKAVVEDEYSPITIVFDRAMVPATTLAISENFVPPITIDPKVSGKFKWLGTNTIQFMPERLLPATSYTVTIDKGFQDIYGLNLKENFSWQFETAHPDIVYSYPAPDYAKAGPSTEVIIRFNQAVDQNSLEQNIEWETADTNQKVSFALRLEEDGTKAILTPQQPLAYKTKFVTTVHKNLKSKEGTFTLSEDFILPFTTVGLPVVDMTEPVEGANDAPRYGVTINFSNPMSAENIDQYIKVEPRIENQFNDLSEGQERQGVSITGDFLPSTHYTITLSKEWKDQYGQKMPYDFVLKFTTARVVPDIAFMGRQRFGLIDGYSTQYQQVLQAINVARIKVSLEKVDVSQVWEFLNSGKVSNSANQGTWDVVSPNPLNEVVEIPVDLASRVQNSGLYIMHAAAQDDSLPKLHQAFIVSKTALTLKTFPSGGLVWATDLKSGLPVGGMNISVLSGANKTLLSGTTDQDGFFTFSWPAGFTTTTDNYYSMPMVLVIGEKADDLAVTGNDYSWNQGIEPWNYNISQSYYPEKIRAFVTTDRPLYQPGQDVFFKGIYREDLDTSYQLISTGTKIKTSIINAQGENIWEKELQTDSHGTISDTFTLPTAAPVGNYTVSTQVGNDYFSAPFLVQEYQKPLFQVGVTTDKDEYIRDDQITVNTTAGYYFGAPLAHAKLTYRVFSDDYFFDRGSWNYRFTDMSSECFYCEPNGSQGKLWTEASITTDERGNARFTIPAVFNDEKESQLLSIEVGVEDPNTREIIYTTKEVVIHKGDFYVGVASQNYVVKQKENATFLIQSLNVNGKVRANINGEAQLYKREYKTVKKRGVDGFFYYDTSFADTLVRTTSFATNNEGKGQVVFTIPDGGQYHILVRASDSKGHLVTSATDIWASSETYINWGRDNNDMMEIIPDKDHYEIGDTAKLLLKSPYEGVKAMMTIERNGILEKKIIDIPTTATVIEVPLKSEYLPNVFVSVTAVKGYGKDNVPGFKLGYINLRLDNLARKLNVSLTPDKQSYEPGTVVSVDMLVKDAEGNPVSGDFAVAVVDQGLLALTGNRDDDLLERFFGQRSLAVTTYESLVNLIQRIDVKKNGGTKGGSGSDGLAKRKNFKDTAYFNPHITTDNDGKATVKFTLPDNITTWQVWAFGATDKTNVGGTTIQVISRKDVFVEPILPRFLTTQDKSHIGAVIHNMSNQPIGATIGLSADKAQVDSASRDIQIAAQSSQTIYWNAVANTTATGAMFTYSLKAPNAEDIVARSLPVIPWVTKETTAFGGVVQSNTAIEQIVIPVGTLSESVTARVNITADLQDTTKLFYEGIADNSYESADVLSAKLLALSLSPVALAPNDKEEQIGELLQKLYTYAQNDGGFTYFPGNNESDPFLSASIAFTLNNLLAEKIHVDAWINDRLNEYLINYFNQTSTTLTAEELGRFTAEGRQDAQSRVEWILNNKAYIAYVLTSNGNTVLSTQGLVDRSAELSLSGQGYLAMALQNLGRSEQAKGIINTLQNKMIKSANLVHFEESGDFWDSPSKLHMNIVLLNMFMQDASSNNAQLINDLMRYIVIARSAAWYGDSYADSAYIWAIHQWGEKHPSSTNTRWSLMLNDTELASGNQNQEVDLSAHLLRDNLATNTLVIQKSSTAPLYYWGTMSYEQRGEDAQPRTEGLGIYREYFDLNDKAESQPLTTFNRNQDVRVKLTVIVPDDQNFAIIEDNLPAGLTAQNFVFQTTSAWQEKLLSEINNLQIDRSTVNDELGPLSWDYQEIRDASVITYASNLPKGVYTLSYLAKAGVQGTYKVRPARVFLQRAPDVFGTTAVGTIEVK